MADHFYSVALGDALGSGVTVGTSTSSEAVELRVTDAVTGITGNKVQVLLAIEKIKRYIETHDAPA